MQTLIRLSFLDVSAVYIVISLVVSLIMFIAALVYLIINMRAIRLAQDTLNELGGKISKLKDYGMHNLEELDKIFAQVKLAGLKKAYADIVADSHSLYQDRWLPDLNRYFRFEIIFSAMAQNSLSWRPTATIFSTGLLATVITAILQNQLPLASLEMAQALIIIPLGVGLAASVLLAAQAITGTRTLQTMILQFNCVIGRYLPIFNEQTGVALLVNQVMEHDFQMNEAIEKLDATMLKFSENEMAEAVKSSVELILRETVSPPIQQSAQALGQLAQELTNRQEQGMQELSKNFSEALAADLYRYLGPINKELSKMTALMADVKNYIDYAMKALEFTKQQSTAVLEDAQQSLQLIAHAREDLGDDFAVFGEQLKLLGRVSEKLAALQSGEEHSLKELLAGLQEQLYQHSTQLQKSLLEAAKTAEIANHLTERQETSAAHILELLGRQNQELGQTSANLQEQLEVFMSGSDQHVKQTLQSFDHGLAELVERLSYTTAEIRDAVDALPAALRQGPDYRG